MSDVLFRDLLKAREHDRSWLQRAFLSDERRLAAGIERLIETAAIRVEVVSQHERISLETVTGPASRQRKIRFVDDPQAHPPDPNHPVSRVDRFALRSTLQVRTCLGCRGSGEGRCDHCSGTGALLGGHEAQIRSCEQCHGTGSTRHHECGGEGEVATWDEEVHAYTLEKHADTFLPEEAPSSARKAVEEWLGAHHDSTSDSLQKSAFAALGYETPELLSVIRRAEMRQSSYEHAARTHAARCLFVNARYSIVPMSACYARSEITSRQTRSWLVGRGRDAIELAPRPFVDPWKAMTWPGLAVGSATGLEAWMQLHGTSLALPFAATSAAVPAVLTGLAVAGLSGAGVGVQRILAGHRRAVRTIAVLACGGEPTLYLPCLAALGSHVRALEVLDRLWRRNLESLLGEAEASSFSRTLGLRTAHGDVVRLIEVADPHRLTPEEARRMTEASQGILFLETPESPQESLRSRIHSATTLRPTELSLLLDAHAEEADQRGRTPGNGLALGAIRRAFVGETKHTFDWAAVFVELWGPLSALLSEREGQRPARLRVTSPVRFATRARS
jgi:hypothetical protein